MTTRFSAAVLMCGVLALSGCVQTTATAPGEDPNRTRQGAILGGVAGAAAGILGSDEEDRGRNAAIGAALGAGVGAAIGNRLDRQEAALRQQLGDGRIQIENTGEVLIVRMPQDILFATDSSDLQPAVVPDLRAVAANLTQFPDGTVDVIGHTDNTGAASYNLELSQRRAQSVANVLVGAGVPERRLRVIGVGDDRPRATNLTAEGRALNRRVEIVIRPSAA
jgi:outer membrane protein OmpA-like peptidoglycan-associated protein